MAEQIPKMYFGIDVGGTNTAFGLVNAAGKILHRGSILTAGYNSAQEYVDSLSAALKDLVRREGLEANVKGVGIGTPNGNYVTGVIENAVNISWAKGNVPLAKMITEKTGWPCKLTNDANAAAVGESAYGVARGMKDFIVLTLGTGIGSGIFCNGQLVAGADGLAGELGHTTIIRHNGRPCGCGRQGCLETYCSATGVARTAREFLEIYPEKKSTLAAITDRSLNSKDVYNAAQAGDELAIDIFNYTGKILGEALCDFIAFSSPQAIILFGGLAHAGDLLLKPLKEAMDKNLLFLYRGHTEILISTLNDAESAILGASALAWE